MAMENNGMSVGEIAERVAQLQYVAEQATAQANELKDQLRGMEPGVFSVQGPDTTGVVYEVKVTTNSRLDDGLARKYLGADEYDSVSKQTLDTAKARALLSGGSLEAITKHYANKVEIKVKGN